MADPFQIPFSNYGSTRLDADEQRRINMYPNSNREGMRQFPGAREFGSISTSEVLSSSLDPTSEDTNPLASWISEDGLNAVVSGQTNNMLYQYTLTTAFDLSTATYASKSFDLSTVTGQSNDIANSIDFSPNGLKMILTMNGESKLFECDLTAEFDISTATFTDSKDLSNEGSIGTNDLTGTWWRNGDEVWITTGNPARIHQVVFAAGTDYTVNRSVTVTSSSSLFAGSVWGLDLSESGSIVRTLEFGGDLYIYTMSTPFDLSTLSIGATLITLTGSHGGLQYRDGDNRFYVTNLTDDLFEEYSLGGAGRGFLEMNGVLYAVIGPTLWSVDQFGITTSIGTIANQPNIVGISTDGTNLTITAGDTKYNYTTAGGLVTISDADLGDAYTSAFLDQRTYYDQSSGQVVGSALLDPTDIDPLDFQTAESFNDDVLAVEKMDQLLYVCGETTIEPFNTSGLSRPLLRRQTVIEHGIVGRRAVDSIDGTMYILDENRRPARIRGLQLEPIASGIALGDELDSYSVVSDCVVSTFSWENENFIQYLFPSADTAWVLHESSGQWSKRENSDGDAYDGIFFAEIYGYTLALARKTGNILRLASTLYQDDGSAITRTLDSTLINSKLLGVPDQSLSISRTKIAYDCNSSTVLTVSCSRDDASGGIESFGQSQSFTLAAGSGVLEVQRFPGGKCRECIIRITTTSNSKVEILSLTIDASVRRDTND